MPAQIVMDRHNIFPMEYTRLFDIVAQKCKEDAWSVMLSSKVDGNWKTHSSSEVWNKARQLAGGLLSLGLSKDLSTPETQEKIVIISPNRPEWLIIDIAVQLTGSVLTPIYPTISPSEIAFILREANVRFVFIANKELYERFQSTFKKIENLEIVFSLDEIEGVNNWKELIEKNLLPDEKLLAQINEDTLATIIYTSGTTGDPKGVMLTHKNIVSNIQDSMPSFTFAIKGEKALSFLPLNHIFEKMITYLYLQAGIAIYYAENMDTIGENLREVRPLVFSTVPRLLEKVYEKIMAKAIELKGLKRVLFFWALELGKQYDNSVKGSISYRVQLWLANKIVFNKWREALGGNVSAIVTGSAACQERLIRIFSAAQIIIMEGYGLTETSPVVTVNRFESEGRRIGTVGATICNIEVKIADDGEILTRGNNVMSGYYKRPELTAEVLKDGWFYTGDIGEWVDGKFLKLTDRKKEIFKTSGGKYVSPQVVENKLKESPFIEQVMVVGADKKFVSALIVPNFLALKKYLKLHHKLQSNTNEEVIAQKDVEELIHKQIEKLNAHFNHVEQVKKFCLLSNEWNIDSGELTPSLKIRRKVLLQKFSKEIEKLYGE
jgi:long-chain acyl-CoA synthetase